MTSELTSGADAKFSSSKRKIGRRKGGRKRGFYYRNGRGWNAQAAGKSYPLFAENGSKLVDRNTPLAIVESAFKRWADERAKIEAATQAGDMMPVMEVCRRYLDYCKSENAKTTFTKRWEFLFDFATGYPPRFKDKPQDVTPKDRIHQGYGDKPACDLTLKDVEDWVKAHPGWKNPRIQKQAVLRAFNWASRPETGLLSKSPMAGLKVGKSGQRITYFTPAEEAALIESAGEQTAVAIRFCILTGCRPASEFAVIEAQNIEDNEYGMSVFLNNHKTMKTKGGFREIIIPPELVDLIRQRIKQYPNGPIFRNEQDNPWGKHSLMQAFRRAKAKSKKNGLEIHKGACMYSCRHTYAKRLLSGFYGEALTLYQVAQLMGNDPEICRKHYGQWEEHGKKLLRQAFNNRKPK